MSRDIAAEARDITSAAEGQTIPSLFRDAVERHPDAVAVRWKEGDAWRERTWKESAELSRAFGNGMLSLGMAPGEFANILSANRPEYYTIDLGILCAGGTPVSLYNSLAPEQIEYIVNHSEAAFVVLENATFFEKLSSIRSQIPNVRKVILIEGAEKHAGDDWVISLADVLEAGRRYDEQHPHELDDRTAAIGPDSLTTLIYTSGTTGPPKGVMVSQRNVTWTAESLYRIWPGHPGMRHISYLPLAHIAERMIGYYLHVKGGTTCTFCPNPQQIAQYLVEVRPELFFAVPRIWEKLYYGLTAAIANNPDGKQKTVVEEAIATCLEKVRLEQEGRPVPAELATKAEAAAPVTRAIRAKIGLDEVKIASTGAAPIAPEILEWFHAIGIPIAEVYGQSEDTGPTSWNRPGAIRIGTVGPSIPGVEVRLAEDGELLVRGANVTRGYYKAPDQTADTFDSEGWLHSGDIARIDDDGFIRIVDRKKEIIITAGGKNIAPSNIENLLKQKPLIGQVCVIGDRRPYCAALIVLDAETALAWAKTKGLPENLAELAAHEVVRSEIDEYIAEINTHLHNQEQIKRYTVLPDEWTPDSGELTPTLKMKRRVVNERYGDAIERMYG